MDSRFTYTETDEMQPKYCKACHAHIPEKLLKAFGNQCPECEELARKADEKRRYQIVTQDQSLQRAIDYQREQQFAINTGLGKCGQCGSTNLFQLENTERHGSGSALRAAGVLLLVLGLPTILLCGLGFLLMLAGIIVFIVGLAVPNTRRIGSSRQCKMCGNRWQI